MIPQDGGVEDGELGEEGDDEAVAEAGANGVDLELAGHVVIEVEDNSIAKDLGER